MQERENNEIWLGFQRLSSDEVGTMAMATGPS